ncbi:MAG: hypothetical protein IJA55_00775 [Clostridia bacterium]|nr:hypothetical protein [Clostridia bacterium]
MKKHFYQKLQQDFVTVRRIYAEGNFNSLELEDVLADIRDARKTVSARSTKDERELLLYCIDTLLQIISENDPVKIFDFADTIHNVPEIYMGLRNQYSLYREINYFRKKYGKAYFLDYLRVKPRFTKNAPKNKWEFFFPESDETFKKLHPVGYYVLAFIGLAALMLPIILYMLYVSCVNPSPNEWPMGLGFLGGFIMGIGLFNIVAAFIHQYLGHLLTVICLSGGSVIMAVSLYLLYK